VSSLHADEVLADFAHQLRQPLSALEALTSYLDLIVSSDEPRVHEQLRRMHIEIDYADQIIREGLKTVRAYLSEAGTSHAELAQVSPLASVVEELIRPLTSATIASATY